MSVRRDRGALPALRGTAYVLTSHASLLFIAIVIYGYVQLNRTQTTLEDDGAQVNLGEQLWPRSASAIKDAVDHLPVPSLANPASPPSAPAGRGN